MKGWIVYNGYYESESTAKVVDALCDRLLRLGAEVEKVPSNSLIFCYNEKGEIEFPSGLTKPDFAIFWDKDINLARLLEFLGIRLFNNCKGLEICDSKIHSAHALLGSGLKFPATIFHPMVYPVSTDLDCGFIDKVVDRLGLPVVVKESSGSFGMQVYLANDKDELILLRANLAHKQHLYQQFIENSKGTDMRVIVIGGKAVAAMKRVNEKDFRANLELGGNGSNVCPSPEFVFAAERVASLLKLDYCGVDLLFGEDGPIVCEVNSNAYFNGITVCSGVDIALEYARHIIVTLSNERGE